MVSATQSADPTYDRITAYLDRAVAALPPASTGRVLVKEVPGNYRLLHAKQLEAENQFRWVELCQHIASESFVLLDGVDPELFSNGKDIATKRKAPSRPRHLLLCRLYAQTEVAKAQRPYFGAEAGFSALLVLAKGGDERTENVTAKSDRFFDVCQAVREQFPGWSIAEALF